MLVSAALALAAVLIGALVWRLRLARVREATAEGRLAALLESLAAGLSVWDPAGRLIACNGRFREFYPTVTLKPGLVFEDLVRYTATRAVVLVPEREIEAWVADHLGRLGRATVETARTPDDRWIEIRTMPGDRGETVLLYTDVTATYAAAAARAGRDDETASRAAGLRMLQRAVAIGRDATSFHQAARDILGVVAAWGGWHAATTYLLPADGGDVASATGVWAETEGAALPPARRAAIDACCDDPDDQVIRRVVASGAPAWIGNLEVDPRLSDRRRDALTDIRSLCALPVGAGGRVVAVAELFSRVARPPDPGRERLMVDAFEQLARVFERERRGELVESVSGSPR